MRGNRRADTKPELSLRSALHRRGLRFRVHLPVIVGGLRVVPDVFFPKARMAVFVDGCLWHRCPEHGTTPRSNAEYWSAKLARNVDRDRRVDEGLRMGGFTVIRVWEHEIKGNPQAVAEVIAELISLSVRVDGELPDRRSC
jgi:DNA mismatch endonuclease (patch repair protein)